MIRSNGEKWQLLNGEVYSCTSLGHSSRQKEEQVFIGKQKDDMDGAAVPTPYIQQYFCTTVWFFSNETKDDDITREPIELLKFWKERLKEYVLAFIQSKF